MPEKQICGNCGHSKAEHLEFTLEELDGNVKLKEVCIVPDCLCEHFKPQIFCRNCGKPKGEHIHRGENIWCLGYLISVFEPAQKSEKKVNGE